MANAMERLDEKSLELRGMLGEIEMGVISEGVTLSSLMREGTRVTGHQRAAFSADGENTCGLASVFVALKARGLAE